jgi:hypothetical protein
MASPFYLVIKGKFTIIGKEPDGDSVRFIANNTDIYQKLHRSYRIKPSRDRSVQLRLEGIDAPEVHYGKYGQILGEKARKQLLTRMGFTSIKFSGDQVDAANPASVSGAILSKAADANGRPVSYLLLEADTEQLEDEDWTRVDADLLKKTLNFQI